MADKKDSQPSQPEPAEKQALPHPTVMKPSARDDGSSGTAGGVAESGERLEPTVIDASRSGTGHLQVLASETGQPRPGSAKVRTPTAVLGFERKRLPVDLDALRNLSPDAKPEVLARALQLLQAYVVETGTDRAAVLWGNEVQRDYAGLVSDTLALSQADVLRRVAGYVSRMMEILQSIDLASFSGTAVGAKALGKYLKKLNKKIDSPEELQAARVELDQLVGLMSNAMDDLLELKEKLDHSSGRIDEIRDDAEASALAAEFLSSHLQDKDKQMSQLFLERSMSLTQTALQIRSSTSMRATQIEQPLRLISAIQNVALVMVPGWLGSIASLTVLTQGRKPTPTEAGELTFQLRKILEQLQT